MNIFTPAVLLFTSFWAASFLLQSTTPNLTSRRDDDSDRKPDGASCPTEWVAMPFTPPPVHIA